MTKEEKKIAHQVIILLTIFMEETRRDYLKMEAERLIRKIEKKPLLMKHHGLPPGREAL